MRFTRKGPASVYYNEIDRYCCQWLSNLIRDGLITPGTIDPRSIKERRTP